MNGVDQTKNLVEERNVAECIITQAKKSYFYGFESGAKPLGALEIMKTVFLQPPMSW